MKFERSAGILLHPSSLPGPDGIGDLGPETYRWIQFLRTCGCSIWQVLPLGPTGYGDSPYQCFSAFAGNPYLVSPTRLVEEGLLTRKDLADRPEFPSGKVDYGPVIQWKLTILSRAFQHFTAQPDPDGVEQFANFYRQNEHWLADYALFMAIKEAHHGVSWEHWPLELRLREPNTLESFRSSHEQDVRRHAFFQFLFYRQWQDLRAYAREKGITLVGDAPIFVSYDSADVWARPDLFHLSPEGKPVVVAGVPPDYFSATGQLWGNPLYRWDVHAAQGYDWWIRRIRSVLTQVDVIRLDHFRGFAGYWEVPAAAPTAQIGRWVPGPGVRFFEALRDSLGELPIIAEDLGEITPDVIALRDGLNLPGMKILQFAFANDEEDAFLPHNYQSNCIVYTGTHDNDTTTGWYRTAPEVERDFVRRYLGRSGEDIAWDMVRAALSSVADCAVVPMQDLLALDSPARMNYPGRPAGNWGWRLEADQMSGIIASRLHGLVQLYNRLPAADKPPRKPAVTPGYFL